MSNLLVVTQAEYDQFVDLIFREDLWVAILDQIIGSRLRRMLTGHPLKLQIVTSETVAEADRVIPEPTLIYHDQGGRWALLGDEDGQLHLLDVATPPIGLGESQLVDEPGRLVQLLRLDPPPSDAPPEHGGFGGFVRYDMIELKAWRVRRVILWTAFDAVDRTWYRSSYVRPIPQEPYSTT